MSQSYQSMKKFVFGIARLWKSLNSWLEYHSPLLSAWAALCSIVVMPLLLYGGYATYLQVKDFLSRPDIELFLDNPKDVYFRLVNLSSVLMRDPQYLFLLYDLNSSQTHEGEDAGDLNIPVKSMKYIRPKSAIGPFRIKDLSKNSKEVPNGHIVFGWASVQCPDCVSRKHYWLLMKKGEDAWYSNIAIEDQPSIMKNLSLVLEKGADFSKIISEIIPVEKRTHVTDLDK